MSETNREIELKFALTPEQRDAILERPECADTIAVRRLVSTYFDTADHALRRAGYTLRLRRESGRWIQTVKSCAAGEGLVRGEWSAAAPRGRPDPALITCKPVADMLTGADMTPLFTVDMTRRIVTLVNARSRIELCLDEGEVRVADRVAPVLELELELKSGAPKTLLAYARRLRDAHALRPAFVSKAERGFALFPPIGLEAPRFAPAVISREMRAHEAFAATAYAALKHSVAQAERLRETPDAEAVHQLRVGARRLRSLIWIFKPITGDTQAARINRAWKHLASRLGPAREIDVCLDGAFALFDWRADAEARDAVERRLRSVRKRAYARAHRAVEDDRFSALVFETLSWIESGRLSAPARDEPITDFTAASLDRARRRVARRTKKFGRLEPQARHAARIAAKTLRYAAEAFGPLFDAHPKRRRRFLARVKTVLANLGDLNDLAVGRAVFGSPGPAPVLAWLGDRETSLMKAAKKSLRRFAKAERFWPRE